jgi:hypothetical protein
MAQKQAEEDEDVYKKYSIRSEHSICVTAEEKKSSNIWIDGKLWFN